MHQNECRKANHNQSIDIAPYIKIIFMNSLYLNSNRNKWGRGRKNKHRRNCKRKQIQMIDFKERERRVELK